MRPGTRAVAILAGTLALGAPARAQETPPDPAEVVNALLDRLMRFRDMSGAELQQEVAEIGGVPFKSDVPLDYLSRDDLSRYLKDLLDSEYPRARAEADQRTLVAFDLLEPGTDLRALRGRLLEENVAGFYDERPGRKRLYAVSAERSLTPANQMVLAHELRHALQDQYMEIHALLPDSVGDFDDRRMALLSLLEGDATLLMERFMFRRLPGLGEGRGPDLSGLSAPAIPGAPPVLRDQLVLPYFAGLDFARSLLEKGGWEALRRVWARPPDSTEQVLHPEKFAEREAPREVEMTYAPRGGTLLNEGVLGEALIRTLLGQGAEVAAAGWGGDRFRAYDVSGRTLLAWRSVWDTPGDQREFLGALHARFARSHGAGRSLEGFTLYSRKEWTVAMVPKGDGIIFVASDDAGALFLAMRGSR